MDGLLRNYNDAKVERYAGEPPGMETIQMQLQRRLQEHRGHIERIEALLDLLEKNPDFEKMLNLTRQVL